MLPVVAVEVSKEHIWERIALAIRWWC